MGNSSGLAYDIDEEAIEYSGIIPWQLNDASKRIEKDEVKEVVSIFKMHMKTANPDELLLAQRNVQKLRTLRHPNVLTFVESAEMDDAVALVTEAVIPLELWLKNAAAASDLTHDQEPTESIQAQELFWGFKCILSALNFLHSNGSLLHGNLGLHSIFVTRGGDWKLGAMELAVKLSSVEDVEFFLKNQQRLPRYYSPPERQRLGPSASASDIADILTSKLPPAYIDMFSFGQCIQKAFSALKIEAPKSVNKYMSALLHAEMKKRPSALKLSQSAMFNSEHIAFLDEVDALRLQAPKEFLQTVDKMGPKVASSLSRSVCAYKVLPTVARIMQIAVSDFPQRDAREGSRQSVQVCLTLLSQLAERQKVDEAVFRRSCVPVLVQLWGMGDRALRTSMLHALKALAPLMPKAVINKHVFDNMVAGFSDSNPKLRETTLMSLIYIVDKLEESVLQDRLVRVVVNLQNDVEPSIRTNTTIFIGKISGRMKESVRARVLSNTLIKAMKDSFMHCRIAGLRTASACIKMLDVSAVAAKIVPQASVLALDKSAEVRSLALGLLEGCVQLLRRSHEQLSAQQAKKKVGDPLQKDEGKSTVAPAAPGPGEGGTMCDQGQQARTQAEPGASSSSSSWATWSVLQGLSKTIESATLSTEDTPRTTANSTAARSRIDTPKHEEAPLALSTLRNDPHPPSGQFDVRGGVGGSHSASDTLSFSQEVNLLGSVGQEGPGMVDGGMGGGMEMDMGNAASWDVDMDLDDLDLDDLAQGQDGDAPLSAPASAQRSASDGSAVSVESALSLLGPAVGGSTGSTALSSSSAKVGTGQAKDRIEGIGSSSKVTSSKGSGKIGALGAAGKVAKPAKVLVKKLDVGSGDDNWDDF